MLVNDVPDTLRAAQYSNGIRRSQRSSHCRRDIQPTSVMGSAVPSRGLAAAPDGSDRARRPGRTSRPRRPGRTRRDRPAVSGKPRPSAASRAADLARWGSCAVEALVEARESRPTMGRSRCSTPGRLLDSWPPPVDRGTSGPVRDRRRCIRRRRRVADPQVRNVSGQLSPRSVEAGEVDRRYSLIARRAHGIGGSVRRSDEEVGGAHSSRRDTSSGSSRRRPPR
jgi:hypothetical protein